MRRDHDGDVDMTVPQPIYEFVQTPRLTEWSQEALIVWYRERSRYEEKLRERCMVSGEDYHSLVTSVRNSFAMQTLEHVARFILKKPLSQVDDEALVREIKRRISTLVNGHVPDLEKLFKSSVKMDLKEKDVEARILKYYMLFDEVVEKHGLGSVAGPGREDEPGYQDRMALRCKFLIANVAPEMLRIEIERLAVVNPAVKKNDIVLFDCLVECAREQQHYHLLTQELKGVVLWVQCVTPF
jgi:hypothetical protein